MNSTEQLIIYEKLKILHPEFARFLETKGTLVNTPYCTVHKTQSGIEKNHFDFGVLMPNPERLDWYPPFEPLIGVTPENRDRHFVQINRWNPNEPMPEPIFHARIKGTLMPFYSFIGETGDDNWIIYKFDSKDVVNNFGLLTPKDMDTYVSSLRISLEGVDQTQSVSPYVQDMLDGLKLLKSLESERSPEAQLTAFQNHQSRLETGN